MQPPTDDPSYLAKSSTNVYAAMAEADPDAIWLMQGWLFQNAAFWKEPQIKAYLGAVGKARMWLLDLFGDSNPIWVKTSSFYGHPYFLCTLLNFGGQQGITGNMGRLLAGVHSSLANSSITGVGITMEGIWTNYPVFEITFQQAWASPPPPPAPPAPPPAPCEWAAEVKDTYLANLVSSADGGWPYDDAKLEAAKAWCCAHDDCGGVTLQEGTFQVRASTTPIHETGPASWARKNFVPTPDPSGAARELPEWFTRYGTRRYGQTDPKAVAAWEYLGKNVYTNGGGGFGSAVSSVPVLGSPPGPPGPPVPPVPQPPAPSVKGYHRKTGADGFWGVAPAPVVTTIEHCADICTKLKPAGFPGIQCVAFEVALDDPPDSGNCYTFTSMKGAFTANPTSRTYIRDSTPADAAAAPALTHSWEAAVPAHHHQQPQQQQQQQQQWAPISVGDKAAAANLGECYHSEGREISLEAASVFQQAWAMLLDASATLGTVASFRFDLIDLGRQVIGNHFAAVYAQYRAAFLKQDKASCAELSQELLTILDDYDALLSTDVNFMLGRWQSWARGWADAGADDVRSNLDYNALNQLTLWGPTGQINDYAKKEWGGLVRAYYKQRYQLLFTMAEESLTKGYAWEQGLYTSRLLTEVELPFQTNTTTFPVEPEADPIATSQTMIKKYGGGQWRNNHSVY